MGQPQLFASDLDGTFLNDGKNFDKKHFGTILTRLKENDAHFIVSTGRDLNIVTDLFKEFAGKVDIVADNGAIVLAADGKILNTEVLAHQSLIDAIDVIEAMPFDMTRGAIFVGENKKFMLNRHKNLLVMNLVFRKAVGVTNYVENLDEIDEPILKVTFGFEETDTMFFIEQAQKKLAGAAHVTTSGYGSVDIVGTNVNKASGIKFVAEHYGLDAHDLVAFGDGLNDLEMLKSAHYPYAMPNGDPGLLEMFNVAIDDNKHDGVLRTIDEIINEKN
ncbi:MAG: HAD family hydrolase [Lactobacillaceae bacterium]|jgi:Cof subfamily protein (haloacid dehalogenase superfamily)|nr:HAD family hydrolase [Lactobacillaceae bacterium]